MRRLGLILAGLGVVACSRPNPDYENSATEGAEGSGSSSGPTLTDGTSADGSSSGGTTLDGSTGPADTDAPPQCDLYAINAIGELYMIDADKPDAILVAGPSPMYESRALATHPATGVLYYTLVDNATDVMTVDPVDFSVYPDIIPFPEPRWAPFVRAAFKGPTLWLGTEEAGRFGIFVPGDRIVLNYPVPGAGGGGDVLPLPDELALVLTETGTALITDFVTAEAIPVNGLQSDAPFTGVARDDEDRLWASTAGPQSDLLEITLEPGQTGPSAVIVLQRTPLEIQIDDLAPIRVHADPC